MAALTRGKPANDAEKARLAVLLALLLVVLVVALMRLWGSDTLITANASLDEVSYSPRQLPVLASWDANQEPVAAADGEHRNPFTFGAPPTPTPDLTPKPTPTPRPTSPPVTPPPAPPRRPPPPQPRPPRRAREYLGHIGPPRKKVAAFRKKPSSPDSPKEIEVAVQGEVLDDKFIVREIGFESVLIGFVGFDLSEDARVPLADK